MGKVHGSLARAGKVKGQTPKVEPSGEKKKLPTGRAKKRMQYNVRTRHHTPSPPPTPSPPDRRHQTANSPPPRPPPHPPHARIHHLCAIGIAQRRFVNVATAAGGKKLGPNRSVLARPTGWYVGGDTKWQHFARGRRRAGNSGVDLPGLGAGGVQFHPDRCWPQPPTVANSHATGYITPFSIPPVRTHAHTRDAHACTSILRHHYPTATIGRRPRPHSSCPRPRQS